MTLLTTISQPERFHTVSKQTQHNNNRFIYRKQGLRRTQKLRQCTNWKENLRVCKLAKASNKKKWSVQLVHLAGLSSWSVQLVLPASSSSWFIQLVRPAGLSSWSAKLVCPAGPSSLSIQLVHPTGQSSLSVQLIHPAGLSRRPI